MGLSCKKDTAYGATATYWRIVDYDYDYVRRSLRLSVAGYIDQEARKLGNTPLITWACTFVDGNKECPFLPDAVRKDLYEAIKALPYWEGAGDC